MKIGFKCEFSSLEQHEGKMFLYDLILAIPPNLLKIPLGN